MKDGRAMSLADQSQTCKPTQWSRRQAVTPILKGSDSRWSRGRELSKNLIPENKPLSSVSHF